MKTDWKYADTVPEGFMDSIYLTDGGHKHDGVDSDGHAGKIVLTNGAEVTGTLPSAMYQHVHDAGAGDGHQAKIHPYIDIAGISEGDVTLTFPDTQFTVQKQISIRYRKEDAQVAGNPAIVKLIFPSCTGTCNSGGNGILLSPNEKLPAALRPKSAAIYLPVFVVDTNAVWNGVISILVDGTINFGICEKSASDRVVMAVGNFTPGNVQKGFYEFVVQYPIYP